ncbi:orcokinin peptides type A-like [Paramacrobiotus metropolitanus]|uniref:orcokinin peptides type A-like n=1 Tax=Paramacrobiotus metropolitanus TaxID=2943436 RepID=UPI0024456C32|nr:orcokinin peptides type A-like [Paramacrobiotus metropolitanus]
MPSWITGFGYNVVIALVSVAICHALIDENLREERGFDSLIGGGLGRDLSHTLRKSQLNQRSRMDSLTGFGLGRSFDNDYILYQYPPWAAMQRPYSIPATEVSKRGFDPIDSASGFGGFSKRNFDQLDRPGFGELSKRSMGKRNFDTLDRPGFGSFSRR